MPKEFSYEEEHEITELVLTLTNEGDLYPERLKVELALEKDFRAGNWVENLAAKAYAPLLNKVAAQLKASFPSSKYVFTPRVKQEAAREMARILRAECEIGNFHTDLECGQMQGGF